MKRKLISTDEFCVHHNIEFSFIQSLCEFGVVNTVTVDRVSYIHEDEILKLERMLRLHRDLDINPEGLDTIDHLLSRMQALQDEVVRLRNRLRLYEDFD